MYADDYPTYYPGFIVCNKTTYDNYVYWPDAMSYLGYGDKGDKIYKCPSTLQDLWRADQPTWKDKGVGRLHAYGVACASSMDAPNQYNFYGNGVSVCYNSATFQFEGTNTTSLQIPQMVHIWLILVLLPRHAIWERQNLFGIEVAMATMAF